MHFNSKLDAETSLSNSNVSNLSDWAGLLSNYEYSSVVDYTGSDYGNINTLLYTTNWDDIGQYTRDRITDLYNAINKFELK